MTNLFKRGFGFIKENPKVLYSLFLIVFIPLTLFYNTFFSIKSFQKNIDLTLQSDALLAESIFESFASDITASPKILQEKIDKIIKQNPEIGKLRVALFKDNKFWLIASSNFGEVGAEIKGGSIPFAWDSEQAVAQLNANEKGERFWEVIKPIRDLAGKKIGIVGMAFSLKNTDDLMRKTIFQAYLVVIIAILLTLFLTLHHTQLFGYVALSRKLQEIDKMKDEFIRMATHELQSPIVNIRGYIEALEEETRSLLNEGQKRYLSIIKISAKNLTDLIGDILEVSRIEQGRLDFTSQKISPAELIKETVEELKIRAERKELKLIFEKKPPCLIEVNPNRFKQVIHNLVENAIKYTLKGEIEVGIETDEAKRKCLIFVRDTGLGIAAEAQKKLTQKFYRVRTKQTAEIPGTGLGLWISKEICQKMGGEIFLESMAGVGSKFTVFFPLIQ